MILGITFAGLNAETVAVNYYFGTNELPLSLLLVLVLAFGSLLGVLAGFTLYLRAKKENFKLRGRIKVVEKEVSNLRSIPLKD